MKKQLTSLLTFLTLTAGAQFSDHFSDGNFTVDPEWTGKAALFEVNGAGQLHLAATVADTAFLSTPSTMISITEWTFWLKMSFNTSANNHARIYLASDEEDLEGPLQGYFLQAGGSSDSVEFYRQQGSLVTRLFTCPGIFTGNSVNTLRFRVTRDIEGNWEIMADSAGGTGFQTQGTFFDDRVVSTNYFGVWCRYTSSNGSKFYFDDLGAGTIQQDTIPPMLMAVTMQGEDSLVLNFSEPLDPLDILPDHFSLASTGASPVLARADPSDPAIVLLAFEIPFPESYCDSLNIRGIRDLKGNPMDDTSGIFCHFHARPYEIVINEIFADPEPSAGLPSSEYLELFNRSDHPLGLKGWTLLTGSYSKHFPEVSIPAFGYLIITADSAYLQWGSIIRLFTSGYSLPNEGDRITLLDQRNHVIHSVNYSSGWYGNSYKKEGGWSLELTDPDNPCGCIDNWSPSLDISGGSPGRLNSANGQNPDITPPRLMRAAIAGNDKVSVMFSEPMDSLTLGGVHNWRINDTLVEEQDVTVIPPDFSVVEIRRAHGFAPGVMYGIRSPAGAADCSGNDVSGESLVMAAVPETPEPGDFIINEILADPWQGGSRFIEIYNRSMRPFDLQDILLSYNEPDPGSHSGMQVPLSDSPFLLMPLEFAVVCEEVVEVISRYGSPFAERFVELPDFPPLSKEGGRIIVQRLDAEIIDAVDYSEEMHHPLLSSTEGISLERVSPDRPSQEVSNWHSAASGAGYATPGERNSQWWTEPVEGTGEVILDPAIFSPDNDGRDDLLHILCRPGEQGFLATCLVFDSRGRKVRQVAGNELIPAEGVFSWDGFTDNRDRAAPGIYIIYLELVKPDGTVKRFKKCASLAVRL